MITRQWFKLTLYYFARVLNDYTDIYLPSSIWVRLKVRKKIATDMATDVFRRSPRTGDNLERGKENSQ